MRHLSEIITRRARQAIEEADQNERAHSGGSVTVEMIADRMAEFMAADHHSVRKQLRRYLDRGHTWRADYIQAFARALGKDPAELVWLDSHPTVSEATRAQLLWGALAERLDLAETRKFVRLASQLLDTQERWGLLVSLAQVIVDAETADQAFRSVSKILLETKAFDGKRRDLRRKSAPDK